ncbi:hypothetical protein [Sphingomonas elodea]|uniref:hypothetical protein n=1 Tax=Sphingomonas elodea TaxID=179878 RepID=UPI000263081D|nr:hypothetical protein [Sphingomonas elodea]
MTGAPGIQAFVARESVVGAGINAVLGILFFLGLFGVSGPVRLAGFGQFAFDFVVQGGASAFMTCLVSLVIARRALAAGRVAVGPLPVVQPGWIAGLGHCLAWAAAGAGAGAIAGAALLATGAATLGWGLALSLKIVFGAVLGAFLSHTMLRRLLLG